MTKRSPAPKPTWEVHVRAVGAENEPWLVKRVEARSVLQAEAILRRQGYEVVLENALQSDVPPDLIAHAKLKPLRCTSCGYRLAGLTLDKANVTCPECSHLQALAVWGEEESEIFNPNLSLVGIFAVIGVIACVCVGLVIIMQVLSL